MAGESGGGGTQTKAAAMNRTKTRGVSRNLSEDLFLARDRAELAAGSGSSVRSQARGEVALGSGVRARARGELATGSGVST